MTNTIRTAIEVLARKGWTKDAFTDEAGRHCLQGALYEAHCLPLPVEKQPGRAVPEDLALDLRLVNEVIGAQYPERLGGVGASRFNDHPETTLEDVVTVLEKAAVRKDEQL
jgi:hypothetical protein